MVQRCQNTSLLVPASVIFTAPEHFGGFGSVCFGGSSSPVLSYISLLMAFLRERISFWLSQLASFRLCLVQSQVMLLRKLLSRFFPVALQP